MTDKTKVPAGGGTPTGTGQEKRQGVAAIPYAYSIKNGAGRQPGFIERLLSYGAENGQTLQDLVRLTGWNERAIRKEIELEQRAGALIISDNKSGYFLTDDPAEAQRFAQSMRHRAAQIRQTATAVEKAAELL